MIIFRSRFSSFLSLYIAHSELEGIIHWVVGIPVWVNLRHKLFPKVQGEILAEPVWVFVSDVS